MKISVRKSRTTDKQIAVINGRIKIGEMQNGKLVALPNIRKSEKLAIDKYNEKLK